MNLEKISEISMVVITNSGTAKSCYMEALQEYKQGKFERGDELMKEGDEFQLISHRTHGELLAKEMGDQESQATMLLIHAEDQLMSAETIRILVEELKCLYSKK